jgi:hypothetical protein
MANPAHKNGQFDPPITRPIPASPNDAEDLPGGVSRGLMIETAGTVSFVDENGEEHIDVPLVQGFHPIHVRRLKAGGTASGIYALY